MKRVCVLISLAAVTALAALGGCDEQESGPIRISAIGGTPRLANPNREALDPPSAMLIQTIAQGLVRFESSGQVQPALAQRWILSDDGLRYTFRLADAQWAGGGKVTADQVVARLNAAVGPGSRNALKPILGAIDEVVAMTDDVLEISLKAPGPHFLELAAQPELGIIRSGQGTGPYRAIRTAGGAMVLEAPVTKEGDNSELPPAILLRGERAGLAVARFQAGSTDLVTGGTLGDLPVARAARPAPESLRFDPVAGLFGLTFLHARGPIHDPKVREALAMAIDREALVAALAVPNLASRSALVPQGVGDLPAPATPAWSRLSSAERRSTASEIIGNLASPQPLILRISIPEGPGYRMLFSFLRSDWRAIGVDARPVRGTAGADLALIDSTAPVPMASWYLRHFTCNASPICSREFDDALDAARGAPTMAQRRDLFATADRLLLDQVPFIAIATPVRWHLVAKRLTGFRPNAAGLHAADQLVAPPR